MERAPILVVDDDDTILNAVKLVLDDEGYTVITAKNGQEALEYAIQHVPRLILLDMKMPIMDGWAFAEAYRAHPGAHAPLIVMTAAQDAAERAAEIQAEAYIAKPFTIDQLLALVQKLLA
jgi:two-component system, chemotaxis family, chemotaxis protein CheY